MLSKIDTFRWTIGRLFWPLINLSRHWREYSSYNKALCIYAPVYADVQTHKELACENIRFSSLFAAGGVSRGGTSATQRQKFHTDGANQCLHNESGSHEVPNINVSNFACLLVDFGDVLCSSAKELQQDSNASSREDYIPQILTVLFREIIRVYIWPLCLLSFDYHS